MTSSSSSLIDDICSELLVCRICLESLRHAKTLSCRHAFCEVCLEKLQDSSELSDDDDDDDDGVRLLTTSRRTSFISRRNTHSAAAAGARRVTCPVCYESCTLPPGGVCRLPDDPVITQLYDVIQRRKPNGTPDDDATAGSTCQICGPKSSTTSGGARPRHRSAHVKCVECSKMMCSHCARLHRRTNVTSSHSLLDLDDADLQTSLECSHHAGELVRYYCDTCDVCVCVLCTYHGQPHCDPQHHDVLSFHEAVALHYAPLTALLSQCRQRLDDARARLDAIVKFDQLVRKVEDEIHEAATEAVSFIRKQERQLVAALRHKCTSSADASKTDGGGKRWLSEHVRRLEDACDGAQRLITAAVTDAGGPAAFLLQRRRTVDAMMTSLMTSQPANAADWSTTRRQQVRFEAYGVNSALGLRVGRLVADDDDDDDDADDSRDDAQSLARQRVHAVTVPSVDFNSSSSESVKMRLMDMGVQTLADDVQSLTASVTRCEASGGVAASGTRHSNEQHPTTASTRRQTADAETLTEPKTLCNDAETLTPVTSLCDAMTLTEPVTSHSDASTSTTKGMTSLRDAETLTVTSVADASTSTPAVTIVSTSTVTDKMTTYDQSTYTNLSTSSVQTSTEPSPDVCHRSTSTEPPLQISRETSTEQLDTRDHQPHRCMTTDKSTLTVDDLTISPHAEQRPYDDNSSLTKLTGDIDRNSRQTTRDSKCSVTALELPRSYTEVDDSYVSTDPPVTSLQLSQAYSVSDLSGSEYQKSAFQTPQNGYNIDDSFESAQSPITPLLQASTSGLSQTLGCSKSRTDDVDSAAISDRSAAVRLAAMLPELARTADVLSASHFSSGLTARLLRDVVDAVQCMTSSSCRLPPTHDAATDMSDHQAHRHASSATIKMSGTADLVDVGVGQSVVTTGDVSTLTKPTTFDKETSTTRTHLINRGTATDSQSTADKQTSMPRDVASAYLASTVSRRVVSVSRGTSTVSSLKVERATSPQRVVLVDKAVTASKAEALEPLDTFQAAGQLSGVGAGPLSPRTRRLASQLSPRSKLACISESAAEQQCEPERAHDADSDDDSAIFGMTRRGSCKTASSPRPGLASTTPQRQLSRNVFNFDHLVTKSSLDDVQTTSPKSASDVTDDVTLATTLASSNPARQFEITQSSTHS